MTDTMAVLVERNRAYLAAYSSADFGANAPAGEQEFLSTADTEARDILNSEPPPVESVADLLAALEYVADDHDWVQPDHARILTRAIDFLKRVA